MLNYQEDNRYNGVSKLATMSLCIWLVKFGFPRYG